MSKLAIYRGPGEGYALPEDQSLNLESGKEVHEAMKVLVTVRNPTLKKIIFHPEAVRRLEALAEVRWAGEDEPYGGDRLERELEGCQACISGWGSPKLTADILAGAGSLGFIGHTAGTIVPYVDESAYERGIRVVNANSALARSTAEGAFALMMSAAWRLPEYAGGIKQGVWSDNFTQTVKGIYGQTIGIIGYGSIAEELIRLLQPFHPQILVYSRHCPPDTAERLGFRLCSLEELLETSGIVSVHNTLTPATRGMLGRRELALLQEGALLVNTARALIIDEAALLECLQAGRISAALDVYWKEPLDKASPLLQLPNVLCTPHIAGFSGHWKSRLAETVIDDLSRWLKGEPLLGEVTAEQYKRLTPG